MYRTGHVYDDTAVELHAMNNTPQPHSVIYDDIPYAVSSSKDIQMQENPSYQTADKNTPWNFVFIHTYNLCRYVSVGFVYRYTCTYIFHTEPFM